MYKGWLVAKAYSQIVGIDYSHIYSLVIKHTSIRALLGLLSSNDYEIEQLNVTIAFLNFALEEEIFLQQIVSFVALGKEDYVCKLNKYLYGLKQSPRQWYKRLDSFMTSYRFKRCTSDNSVYYKKNDNALIIYLLLYKDVTLIAGKIIKEFQKLKDHLTGDFEMKDFGAAKNIVGMEIIHDNKYAIFHHSQKNTLRKS